MGSRACVIKKKLYPAGYRTQDRPAHTAVTTPTELSRSFEGFQFSENMLDQIP